jgi:predicted acyl esterase
MTGRRWRALTAGSAVAALLLAIAHPASAQGNHTISADNTSGDVTISVPGGDTMTFRILAPTDTPVPPAGWPMIIYKMGHGAVRCADQDYLTRAQLAAAGYAVFSVTGRGFPTRDVAQSTANAGNCGSLADLMGDALNDSGNDFFGPLAVSDVSAIIDWAAANTTGVDTGHVGIIGHSLDGPLAPLAAKADSRIKAAVESAGLTMGLKGNNVSAVSNKPLASFGYNYSFLGGDLGYEGHYDPSVETNIEAWSRERYLEQAHSSGTMAWMNARTVVDDDTTVDKAHLITTPIFVVQGFRDMLVSTENALQMYAKLPAGNKYLYVGACVNHYNTCRSNDATYLRDKVIKFFDKYLYGSTTAVGGPVFYCVPANDYVNNDCGATATTTWPPSSAFTVPLYLRGSGVTPNLNESAPTTSETAETINHPFRLTLTDEACTTTTYSAGEYATYTSNALTATGKMVSVDADLYMSSTTERMQVFVDLFEVTSTGVEKPVWPNIPGSNTLATQIVNVPTSYNTTPGTHVRFQFKPATIGYTVPVGSKLRVKIASNLRRAFPTEPLPATFSIYHSNTEPSSVKFTFV